MPLMRIGYVHVTANVRVSCVARAPESSQSRVTNGHPSRRRSADDLPVFLRVCHHARDAQPLVATGKIGKPLEIQRNTPTRNAADS